MMKIRLAICFFLLSVGVFADGKNSFIFRKGKILLDVQACPMNDPLIFSGEREEGIRIEKQVPEEQDSIVYQITFAGRLWAGKKNSNRTEYCFMIGKVRLPKN